MNAEQSNDLLQCTNKDLWVLRMGSFVKHTCLSLFTLIFDLHISEECNLRDSKNSDIRRILEYHSQVIQQYREQNVTGTYK